MSLEMPFYSHAIRYAEQCNLVTAGINRDMIGVHLQLAEQLYVAKQRNGCMVQSGLISCHPWESLSAKLNVAAVSIPRRFVAITLP